MYELIFQELILVDDDLFVSLAQLSLQLQVGPFWDLGFNFDEPVAEKLLLIRLIAWAVLPGTLAMVIRGWTVNVVRVL